MSKPVRIKEHVASRVDVVAEAEHRSFANAVEVLLLEALAERSDVLLEPKSRAVFDAPRKAGPSVVAATVPGVQVLRPHFRKDRPAVQCSERIVAGEVCGVCGAIG